MTRTFALASLTWVTIDPATAAKISLNSAPQLAPVIYVINEIERKQKIRGKVMSFLLRTFLRTKRSS